MKLDQMAERMLGYLRDMDREATTKGEDGTAVGLWYYGAHVGRPKNTEESWSAELAARLTSDGCTVRTEQQFPGTRNRCDLVVDLEGDTRIWIEVKGSWHNYWKGGRSKARTWLLEQVTKDMEKVATLTLSEGTHVGLVLLGFDEPEPYSMDEDFQDLMRTTKLNAPPWQNAEDGWPDPHRPGNRVRCWIWWRALLGSV